LAAFLMAGGLALFVLEGGPRGDHGAISPRAWLMFGALSAGTIATLLVMARERAGAARAALIAGAAGVTFGLSAALTKQALDAWHHGTLHLLATGYPYALVLTAVVGLVLSQSAFQGGALAASLPTLTLAEPIFAALAGSLLFNEHLRPGWHGAVAVGAAVVACGAAAFLARSPRAHRAVAA
jgi:hypothetical protein